MRKGGITISCMATAIDEAEEVRCVHGHGGATGEITEGWDLRKHWLTCVKREEVSPFGDWAMRESRSVCFDGGHIDRMCSISCCRLEVGEVERWLY